LYMHSVENSRLFWKHVRNEVCQEGDKKQAPWQAVCADGSQEN